MEGATKGLTRFGWVVAPLNYVTLSETLCALQDSRLSSTKGYQVWKEQISATERARERVCSSRFHGACVASWWPMLTFSSPSAKPFEFPFYQRPPSEHCLYGSFNRCLFLRTALQHQREAINDRLGRSRLSRSRCGPSRYRCFLRIAVLKI